MKNPAVEDMMKVIETMASAPLKLRPYGTIQMCLLLLLYYRVSGRCGLE